MVAFLRSWLQGLICAALFCAVAAELTPRGAVKRVQSLLCGIVMAAALLLPLRRLELPDYAVGMARSRAAAAEVTQNAEEISRRLNRRSIEAELEAYILDKAQTLGAPVDGVTVEARWSTQGVWYPVAVTVDGAYHPALAAYIEGELGVADTAQHWRTDGNDQPDQAQ